MLSKMAHRRESKHSDHELSDKENKKDKIERRKKRFSSSSCSSSDSSSGSETSSCSSSSNSSSGSSSRSSSSSTTSSSALDVKRKKLVQKIRKTSVRPTAHVISEKKAKPVKEKQDTSKTKTLEKVKPKAEFSKRTVSPRQKWVKRSPSPRSAKIHIGRLTRNITFEHIQEIFSTFGKIKGIDFPTDRTHPNLGKGFAYAEFETADEAENAMKHMDGAQIDGQEITAAPVLIPRPRQVPVRRPSPVPVRRPLPRWGRSGLQYRRNSPPYVRGKSPPPRRRPQSRPRSRSPARRRRYSRSSSSKSR